MRHTTARQFCHLYNVMIEKCVTLITNKIVINDDVINREGRKKLNECNIFYRKRI